MAAGAFSKVDRGATMQEMWEGFESIVLFDAPAEVQSAMKTAFYGGALCLFNWFMVQMDAGEEATENDLTRIDTIDAEIRAYFERTNDA